MHPPLPLADDARILQFPFESLPDLVSIAGTLVLLLLLVAFAGVLYRSVRGDGIQWPDDVEQDDDGVSRRPPGDDEEDEWKFY
ncbi:hypothetical protein [Halobellus rufus]|uniref:hypothetical protein n=1 Tax=Halobellus rufus TaxID=1448860 RepID=UPI0006794A02|nr:hypothetical protein [Halobellus rufus]